MFRLTFPSEGKYEIRALRYTPNNTSGRTSDECIISSLQSLNNDKILNLELKHTMVEMKLVATEKLSGVVQDFSAIAYSVLRHFNANGWTTWARSRNPAVIALDALTGEGNIDPLKDDQIDFTSWNALRVLCDQIVTVKVNGVNKEVRRHTCDVVVDTSQTVQELVNSVLGTARAQLNIQQNGKYGVLIDQIKTVPRQLFTPANSWNFSGRRDFAKTPDAFRVKFIDPATGWAMNEHVVYNDGKNISNAYTFEELGTYGITDYVQAHRHGRYMFKNGVLRSEIFKITVDIENLVVSRGDMVAIQHDVPKMGGMACRIVDINGADLTLDQLFVPVKNQGYSVRTSNGTIKTGGIVNHVDNVITIAAADPDIRIDNLIVVGEKGKETRNYLIKTVTPGVDLTATLELVLYDPLVYTEGDVPEWDPGFGDNPMVGTNLKVVNVTYENKIVHIDRLPYSVVKLSWGIEGSVGTLEKYVIEFKPQVG